jgi:hypothetical protein
MQLADDLHGLLQAALPGLLVRPDLAGDVFVHVLTAAGRHPEAAREHVRERGRGVGDDCRVVPLPGRRHHTEAQLGGGQGGPKPGPGEAGVALPGRPGLNVVRAHRGLEARLLRQLDVLEELSGTDLFVRCVETESSHR